MNKVLICLAGLAALLSQAPAALANPPGWTPPQVAVNGLSAAPATPSAPSGSKPIPDLNSNLMPPPTAIPPDRLTVPPTAAEAPVGVTHGHEYRLPPPLVPTPAEAPPAPLSPAPLPAAAPAQTLNAAQFGTPIPTDLGVQFGLSNSAPTPNAGPKAGSNPAPNGSPATPQPFRPAPPPTAPAFPSLTEQPAPIPPSLSKAEFTLTDLFTGDSDSLVAVTVGNAEGTRTPDGKQNKAFYGHSDPGNGVWNLGTFSYQHGAASPEEADVKQLNRLKKQAQVIQEKATAMGLKLTLEETLNGIDLANQAPKAVIDAQGYVEWLAEAYARGMIGSDAILWARVQSFIDPQTQKWNAPGLGNTADSITRDQNRRMQAIARALDAQNYQIAADARLRSQPIGFRLPRWNFAGRILHQLGTLFH